METLQGKAVWLTGAGSGIGRAAAVALASGGARVVLSGRRRGPLDETAALIREAGGEALVEPLDVTDVHAVEVVVDVVRHRFGRIDILVNNAGVNIPERSWPEITPESWDYLVDVNLNGAFYCAHRVLEVMRRQRDGLIINIVSWAGRRVSPVSGVAYTAAKHALLAMNASLNMEEGRNGVRACAICPGEVATPILDQRPVPVSPEERAKVLQPEDLAETILFVSRMPRHVCLNEILITPTWNRTYIGAADRNPPASTGQRG